MEQKIYFSGFRFLLLGQVLWQLDTTGFVSVAVIIMMAKVIEAFLAFERELGSEVKGMAEPKLINCFLFISGACHTE